MTIRPVKTRVFKEGEELVRFIRAHVRRLPEASVIVVTSKIVALSERRVAPLRSKARAIRAESVWLKRTKYGNLTFKDGLLMWNSGIDESNADGKLVLLPNDSFAAAARMRRELMRLYRVRNLGVVISDSRIMPLRAGVVAVALGYAGFRGLRDYRGKPDIFGRPLKHTQTDVADSLATAAALAMGEGAERQPIAVIERAPVVFTARSVRAELTVSPADDMYRPAFSYPTRTHGRESKKLTSEFQKRSANPRIRPNRRSR